MYCTYNLNYGDADQCYGANGKEYQLKDFKKIKVFEFMSQPYNFFQSDITKKIAEWAMMKKAMKNCQKPDNEWYRCYTFDAICRQARVNTAFNLINEKSLPQNN